MSVHEIKCIACGSSRLERRPAAIAAFISAYALRKPDALTTVLECQDCTMLFFEVRPTDEDMARLYAEYRGDNYFKKRHECEFWYTRNYHDSLNSDATMVSRRQIFLASLARFRDPASFDTVLDYGGDRGQLLIDGPGRRRFVFEMSDMLPEPGIEKISREQDLKPKAYDLILLFHVLEHVSYPLDMLAKIKPLLAPGGLLFVEVPHEKFALRSIPSGGWYRKYLSQVIRHRFLFSLLYIYSAFSLLKWGRVPPLGFAKMHEHINLFTLSALKACLIQSGFIVRDVFRDPQTGNIGAIAQCVD